MARTLAHALVRTKPERARSTAICQARRGNELPKPASPRVRGGGVLVEGGPRTSCRALCGQVAGADGLGSDAALARANTARRSDTTVLGGRGSAPESLSGLPLPQRPSQWSGACNASSHAAGCIPFPRRWRCWSNGDRATRARAGRASHATRESQTAIPARAPAVRNSIMRRCRASRSPSRAAKAATHTRLLAPPPPTGPS